MTNNENSNNMTFDYTFGKESEGNYIKIKMDGGVEQYNNSTSLGEYLPSSLVTSGTGVYFANKYFNNMFIGSGLSRRLELSANATLGVIGDSTGALANNFIQQIAEKYGDLGIAKVVYSTYNNPMNVDAVYGLSADAESELGLVFKDAAGSYVSYPDDGTFDNVEGLAIEYKISQYNDTKPQTFIISKWGYGAANRSFNYNLNGPDAQLVIMENDDNIIYINIPNAVLGAVDSDIIHHKVNYKDDNGSGFYTAQIYTSVDDGINWTYATGVTGTSVGDMRYDRNSDWNINNLNNDEISTFTSSFKLHRIGIRNGVGEEFVNVPTDPFQWEFKDNDNVESDGTVPTLFVYNGCEGGKDYDYFTNEIILRNTVPNPEQYFIVNHGHNQNIKTYADNYQDMNDFYTRLNTNLIRPLIMISTQNPRLADSYRPLIQQAQNLRADQDRIYAIQNNYGCVDSLNAILDTIPNWEDLMEDQTHPGADGVLYGYMADWWVEYLTSNLNVR